MLAQTLLVILGFAKPEWLIADGKEGPRLRVAVLAFQKANGLRKTGRLTRMTFVYLEIAYFEVTDPFKLHPEEEPEPDEHHVEEGLLAS